MMESETMRADPLLPKGSQVWYITDHGLNFFDWYIPATIVAHVLEGKELKGYVLTVDIDDTEFLTREEKFGEEIQPYKHVPQELGCAAPHRVIERWDMSIPPCPVPGVGLELEDRMISNQERVPASRWKSTLIFGVDTESGDHDKRLSCLQDEAKQMKSAGMERTSKAQELHGPNLGFEGATQDGHGPEMWGITLGQLVDIKRDRRFNWAVKNMSNDRVCGGMTMYEVVEGIIKPKTRGKGVGYALLVNREKPLRARVMVSHAWGEDYEHFLEALQDSGIEGPFWVCATAIYQNEDIPSVNIERQLGPHPSTGPFATVLKQASTMVVVITPECDVYTRLWCVYEIFVAISLGVPVKLTYFSERRGLCGSDKTTHNPLLDSPSESIDTSAAHCGMPKDEALIRAEVAKLDGGFHLIDNVVIWVRLAALVDEWQNETGASALMESTVFVPIGVSSSSCAAARVDNAMAKMVRVLGESNHCQAGLSVLSKSS